MEQKTGAKSFSFLWNLAIFLPIAAALARQVLSQLRTDTQVKIMLSDLGNLFLTTSLIAQSLRLTKKGDKLGGTAALRLDRCIWLLPLRIGASNDYLNYAVGRVKQRL